MNDTLSAVLDHAGGVAAILGGIASIIAAFNSARSVTVSREGVEVSSRNEKALTVVAKKQVENAQKQDASKAALTTEIQAVRLDFHNGGGDAIAGKVLVHITPVLEETGRVITAQVAQTAEQVAAALADQAVWNGENRRVGMPDRRVAKPTT